MIHPTAIIHPGAKIGEGVQIGPYAIIDAEVELGANCQLGPHVYLTGRTTIGSGNKFHIGCVIGEAPQDLKYQGGPTRVVIGDNNVFREYANAHGATKPEDATVIGSNCFIMGGVHIGHNVTIGNHVIMGNYSMVAGHGVIQDRAFLSGGSLVHQFCRVGTLALMQGGTAVSKDVPPYTVAHQVNEICGLNIIGLRRAGMGPEERLELKRLYRFIFRTSTPFRTALAEAQEQFHCPAAKTMLEFLATAKRPVCPHSTSRGQSETDDE